MKEGLDGRAVLIFGASGALGSGVAAAFAAAGAAVIEADKSAPEPGALPGPVRHEVVDVLDDAAVGALFDAGPKPWAVVSTVGGFAPWRPLEELGSDELIHQPELNLVTAALITKHALRVMRPTGRGRIRIVLTAGRAAVASASAGFAYSVSKLGVMHLALMAAEEVRGTGITVNCVIPSIIDTPANRTAMPSADHAAWPKVADIADSYLYLTSPEAVLVNGASIPV
jgi:NAD(P)-dependent dehydrogenase (short-subunit alcohol dehydrogenase family)